MNKKYSITNRTLDRIAIASSILCAFHCAILPILITVSAWAGLQYFRNPLIEWGFIILGITLFYVSIWRNLKRHNSKAIKVFAILGVVFLIASRFKVVSNFEVYLTCLGSFFLVCAHLKNIKCLRSKNDF